MNKISNFSNNEKKFMTVRNLVDKYYYRKKNLFPFHFEFLL